MEKIFRIATQRMLCTVEHRIARVVPIYSFISSAVHLLTDNPHNYRVRVVTCTACCKCVQNLEKPFNTLKQTRTKNNFQTEHLDTMEKFYT